LPTANDSTIAICAGRFSASDTNSTADPLKLEPDYAITCKSLYGSCLSIPTLFRLEKAQKISSCDVKPFV